MHDDDLIDITIRAREMGLLDMAAVEASYARLEWRPSRPFLRSALNEFS